VILAGGGAQQIQERLAEGGFAGDAVPVELSEKGGGRRDDAC